MALPRLFVSSTYYDLRFVRADLSALENEVGVEIVRFETGSIPYHTAPTLPEACCKEIDNCHILVSIIGGRYGSTVVTNTLPPRPMSKSMMEKDENDNSEATRLISISRLEVERAIKSGLLLFAFVDSTVMGECRTYNANINRELDISWPTVDSPLIFEFINYIQTLEGKNPIFEFRTPKDIQDILRLQLSGLFCDLLVREKLEKYGSHLDQVIKSAERLETLQSRLRERENEAKAKLKEMTLPDHPFFEQCRNLFQASFRVFFKNKTEFETFIKFFGYKQVNPNEILDGKDKTTLFYHNQEAKPLYRFIGFSKSLFDSSGNLKLPSSDSGKKNAVWYGAKL